jgi:DNA-binding beta-propeller fold protein YncE
VLGVMDATNNTFSTAVSTSFNAHSVAVNRHNNHVFVPLRPPRAGVTPPDPDLCTAFGGPSFSGRGCIGVYWRMEEQLD